MKQLERDLDRQKHGTGQMIARNEQLVKEMEGQKQHGTYSQLQMESLKRELADALVSEKCLCFNNILVSLFDCQMKDFQNIP